MKKLTATQEDYPETDYPWRVTERLLRLCVLRRDDDVVAIDVVKIATGRYGAAVDYGYHPPVPLSDFATREQARAVAERLVGARRRNGYIDADESELPPRRPPSTHLRYDVEVVERWLLDAGAKREYEGKWIRDHRQPGRKRLPPVRAHYEIHVIGCWMKELGIRSHYIGKLLTQRRRRSDR